MYGQLRNCSDPSETSGASCAYYSYPGDSYSQIADYIWNAETGSVQAFQPASESGSIYRPLVKPLISSVKSLVPADLANPVTARGMIVSDFAAYGYANSNTNIGQIHYMSGHDLSGDIAGNLLILQTLLQLGTGAANNPPTTTEVARATPILAAIGGAPAIVQGTLDLISPPQPAPALGSDADVSAFTFPYIDGHLYALPVGSGGGNVTTTGRGVRERDAVVRRRDRDPAGAVRRVPAPRSPRRAAPCSPPPAPAAGPPAAAARTRPRATRSSTARAAPRSRPV